MQMLQWCRLWNGSCYLMQRNTIKTFKELQVFTDSLWGFCVDFHRPQSQRSRDWSVTPANHRLLGKNVYSQPVCEWVLEVARCHTENLLPIALVASRLLWLPILFMKDTDMSENSPPLRRLYSVQLQQCSGFIVCRDCFAYIFFSKRKMQNPYTDNKLLWEASFLTGIECLKQAMARILHQNDSLRHGLMCDCHEKMKYEFSFFRNGNMYVCNS